MFSFKKALALILVSAILMLSTAACAKTDAPLENTTADKDSTVAAFQTTLSTTEVDATDEVESTTAGIEETTTKTFTSTQELVDFFNTAANKIKTEASKVTKNYEKRKTGEIVVPKSLQSTAEKLLASAMKDDTDPIVYTGSEEISAEFPVPEQSYVSRLSADTVEKSSFTEKEDYYEIYFKLKDEKSPRAGKGVDAVCDVIEAHEVAQKAPSFVKELSTYYYDCEIKAKIDKESGRITHITYSTPVTLSVTVEMFGTHDATVNFTFIKDYTVTY